MMRLASGVLHIAGSTPAGGDWPLASAKVYLSPRSTGVPSSPRSSWSRSGWQKPKTTCSPSAESDQLAEPMGVCALPCSKKKKALASRSLHAGRTSSHGPTPTTARCAGADWLSAGLGFLRVVSPLGGTALSFHGGEAADPSLKRSTSTLVAS